MTPGGMATAVYGLPSAVGRATPAACLTLGTSRGRNVAAGTPAAEHSAVNIQKGLELSARTLLLVLIAGKVLHGGVREERCKLSTADTLGDMQNFVARGADTMHVIRCRPSPRVIALM